MCNFFALFPGQFAEKIQLTLTTCRQFKAARHADGDAVVEEVKVSVLIPEKHMKTFSHLWNLNIFKDYLQ